MNSEKRNTKMQWMELVNGVFTYWYSYNKEFSVLHLQSNITIFVFHLLVQQEYNYMFRPYMWAMYSDTSANEDNTLRDHIR